MSWVENCIKDLPIVIADGNYSSKYPKASEFLSEGVPFLSAYNLESGTIIDHNTKYISEEHHSKLVKGHIKKGDVLLVTRGSIGKVAKVPGSYDGANINAQLVLFRPKDNTIDAGFLYYAVANPQFVKTLISSASGAAQPQLPIKILRNLKIRFPKDVFTQRNISSVLEKYDDLIENNKRRIELLEDSARQLYKEWFVRFRFPGHEHVKIIDGVPEGWRKKPLKELLTLNYGKALKAEDRIPGNFPVYGSSGVVGTHAKPLVKGPGIIVGRKGNVGSIFWSHLDFFPIDTVYFVSADESNYFVYYALLHTAFISTDVAVPGLNRDFAYSREIIVPTDTLVSEFEEEVAPIFKQCDVLSRYNEQLAQARDLLLPKLMSGEIAV